MLEEAAENHNSSTMLSNITEGVLEYLINVTQSNVGCMTKLSGFAVLNELFKEDQNNISKVICMKQGLLDSVLIALDSALLCEIDTCDTVYVSVAMELLWQMSKLSIGQIQPLISKMVISRLVQFLNVNGQFYKCCSSMPCEFRRMFVNKHLIAKVKPFCMTADLLETVHRKTDGQLKVLRRLPDRVNICSVYDTSVDKSISVSKHLIDKGFVLPGEEFDKSCVDWTDIIVTEVLEGGFFWAHIGEDDIKAVCDIQSILIRVKASNQLTPHPVRIGQAVVVMGEVLGINCLLRAHILGQEQGLIMVFAFDYGFTISVLREYVFKLPLELYLTSNPPRASLCCLDGICPPPLEKSLVHDAVAILCNLCKQSIPAGEIVADLSGVDLLLHVLASRPGDKLTTQLLYLLNNLACNSRLTRKLTNSDTVKTVINVLKGRDLNSLDMEVNNAWLMCLTSFLYKNDQNCYSFYQCQGMDIVLKMIATSGRSDIIYKSALKLLHSFLGSEVLDYTGQKISCPSSNRKPSPRSSPEYTKKSNQVEESIHPSHLRMDNGISDIEAAAMPKSFLCVLNALVDDTDGEMVMPQKMEGNLENQVVYVNTGELYKTREAEKSFIHKSYVKFQDGATHELRPDGDIKQVSSISVAQHVCGFLNNGKGGSIFFGIDKDQEVFGMELSRSDRDELRLGVDRMMVNKISPLLLHNQYEVTYYPIFQISKDSNREKIRIQDLYVIEISVRGNKGVMYTVTADQKCYYRFGPNTAPISPQELRHLVVIDTEFDYQEEICRLRRELEHLNTFICPKSDQF
ncbi:hypothetical protein CHS0354_024845 [Potamilus streckersoni]|uniref:Tudor domain-containing protein n=1 Tax=Potamilus streckersoni TaxID=2493646 RepID=A0AAE0VHH0_9BIVA|nr:hypothetical protein CHS0354_024845 [Potamilus streckersoni]